MPDHSTNWESLKKHFLDRIGLSRNSGAEVINASAKSLRIKQFLILGSGASLILIGGLYFYLSGDDNPTPTKTNKPVEKAMNALATPLTPVDERETWVNRIEKKTEVVRQEAAQVHEENKILLKRVDVLEELFNSLPNPPPAPAPVNEMPDSPTPAPIPAGGVQGIQQHFPPANSYPETSVTENLSGSHPIKKRGPKIAHLTGHTLSGAQFKASDIYLPAGTYCKAVVDMGIAASTATNSQSNPEPIKLRLVDDGNLPGGLKGQVRDAVLIGACYGDISSERARCRLESLTWKDKNGVQIEKPIEGWVVGEDGLAGLRGKVVDRSGDVAREAFGAGLLSAAANFLKYEATSGAFPSAPYGIPFAQSNPLSKGNALKGAAATGAGNALDKLAEFSIKRAEQMQPVILVASGRVVDVLLKSGVSLTPGNQDDLKVLGASSSNTNTNPETLNQNIQEG